MRWRSGRRSSNIEDQRARGGRRRGGVKLSGGVALIAIVVGLYLGVNPTQLLQLIGGGGGGQAVSGGAGSTSAPSAAEQELADFVSVVLADTEDAWNGLFRSSGKRYEPPKLVLFRDAVQSACGYTQAAVGPFYCPADRKAYLDLGFFEELHNRFQAPGDFAQAYVIAHEIGHHVQNLLGTSSEVQRARRRMSKAQANALSVRLELQADCFAGVWAHHGQRARNILEPDDLEEGLRAAAAIGDDRLQRQSRGYVRPESFTHGTSQQRVTWFKKGFSSGRLADCNTFGR